MLGPYPGASHSPDTTHPIHSDTECAYARQIRGGLDQKLNVYISPEAKRLVFPPNHRKGKTTAEDEKDYVIYPDRNRADLSVELHRPEGRLLPGRSTGSEAEAIFIYENPYIEKRNINRLRQRTRALNGEVEHVLSAVAQWNWHLKRTGGSHTHSTVSIGVFKLGTMYGDYLRPLDGPSCDLNQAGAVDLKVKANDRYGVKLSNKCSASLYIRMFYFDASNFSILDMFGHSRANGQLDPDVAPYGQLTIGDGSNGGALLSFELEPGVEVEVGFLKIFWSTDPLELDDIAQESAFEQSSQVNPNSRKVGLKSTRCTRRQEWGSEIVTVVQRA
ncbi:mycorrhiza-upregulated peptidase C14 [Ceratobasidium sp. AG-Ba]|nr:mycorrhiza-upregulated peptidase C14 [Ceratobasidium sp. AG-Ba]